MHTEHNLPGSSRVPAVDYAEILQFYAEQMHHLDSLNIDAYASTFTRMGTIEHRHAGQKQAGRAQIIEHAYAVLDSYRASGARHWNGGYFAQLTSAPSTSPTYEVRYASLVTHKGDDATTVALKEPFVVTDILKVEEDVLRVELRVIDQP